VGSSVHERIKKERLKLGLNQDDFGKMGGVQRLAQANYEKGERFPNTVYLVNLYKNNVDIVYILTETHLESGNCEKENPSDALDACICKLNEIGKVVLKVKEEIPRYYREAQNSESIKLYNQFKESPVEIQAAIKTMLKPYSNENI